MSYYQNDHSGQICTARDNIDIASRCKVAASDRKLWLHLD